jgi:hypothetical protein
MRPHQGKAADYPGTIARKNNTTCQSCNQRTKRQNRRRRRDTNMLEPDELAAVPGLTRLIMARRQRGIPPTGARTAA